MQVGALVLWPGSHGPVFDHVSPSNPPVCARICRFRRNAWENPKPDLRFSSECEVRVSVEPRGPGGRGSMNTKADGIIVLVFA